MIKDKTEALTMLAKAKSFVVITDKKAVLSIHKDPLDAIITITVLKVMREKIDATIKHIQDKHLPKPANKRQVKSKKEPVKKEK